MAHLFLVLTLITNFAGRAAAQSDTFRIVAVVDHQFPHIASNLQHGVDYLNSAWNPTTLGRTVVMETIMTQNNDSFGAMEQMCEKIQDGISVIVDVSSRHVTAAMCSLAEAMGIGHVSAVDESFEAAAGSYNLSVNIRSPSGEMIWAIRDIVSQENITSAIIIYDLSFDMTDSPKHILRDIPVQHMYLKMATSPETIITQLSKIKESNLFHVFLAGTAAHAQEYLGQANTNGMMNYKYNWYVITKDANVHCPRCSSNSSYVVLSGQPVNPQAQEYIRFMADQLDPDGFTFNDQNLEMSAALQFDMMSMVGAGLGTLLGSGTWQDIDYVDCFSLVDTDPVATAQSRALVEAVASTNRLGVFGEFLWMDQAASQQFKLDVKRELYNNGTLYSSDLIGEWSRSNGLTAFYGTITNTDVTKTYRVITLPEPPFMFKTLNLPEGVTDYHLNTTTGYYYYGYCMDLLMRLKTDLTFEFELSEPPDGLYGTIQSDGSWNGMVKELLEDNADIVVAPLSVMAERENVIDFTVPYYDLVGITILMRKPSFEYELFKFMNPMDTSVWGCIFTAFVMISILLAVFDRLSPFSYQNNRQAYADTGETPRVFTLKEGLWFCMTSLTPQGGGETPRALSGRLVASTWWMFGYIMICTYTANLAAFLTVSRLEVPIETLDDLADQFSVKYAPQEGTATQTYFRRMADIEDKFYDIWRDMSLDGDLDELERAQLAVWDYPVSDKFTQMWISMQETGFPHNFTAAVARVKDQTADSEFAFIGDATKNKYATMIDCDLWEAGEEFSRKPYALAVQEGSSLKNQLSGQILQLLNERFLEELKTRWWDFNRAECPDVENESDGISIQNIGGVFILIFIGIGLGLITLLVEYYMYRWRPQSKAAAQDKDAAEKTPNGGVDNKAYSNGIAG